MAIDVFDRAAPKKATNVSVNSDLLRQAKELGVNLSRTLEAGLENVVREERRRRWLEENRAAIRAYNEHLEKRVSTADEHDPF